MLTQGENLTVERVDINTSLKKSVSVKDIEVGEGIDASVLVKLLNDYRQCIAKNQHKLGRTQLVIEEPVVYRPYKVPFAKRQLLSSMILKLIDCGVVVETQSDYAFPVILIKKKNDEERMCVDYRKLNSITKKVRYPMPLIEEQFIDLAGYKLYIVLDLASGYYRIMIKNEHTHYTAFITPYGLFEFTSII